MNAPERRERDGMDAAPPPLTTPSAVAAIHRGANQLKELRGRRDRVADISGRLSRELVENNFAARIRIAMRGQS